MATGVGIGYQQSTVVCVTSVDRQTDGRVGDAICSETCNVLNANWSRFICLLPCNFVAWLHVSQKIIVCDVLWAVIRFPSRFITHLPQPVSCCSEKQITSWRYITRERSRRISHIYLQLATDTSFSTSSFVTPTLKMGDCIATLYLGRTDDRYRSRYQSAEKYLGVQSRGSMSTAKTVSQQGAETERRNWIQQATRKLQRIAWVKYMLWMHD